MKHTLRKRYLIGLLSLFACQGLMIPQTNEITQKFFADPDFDIQTPAFKKEKGFSSYQEVVQFLEAKVAAHPELFKLDYIGESQKGKKIPLIHVGKEGGKKDKIRIWLQGGLHGNEPAGTEAMLYLLDQFCTEEYIALLEGVELSIVPMANVDGCEKFDRYSANGLDLNRDQTKINAPETRSLKTAFSQFAPHLCLDFHEFRPYRRDFVKMEQFGITHAYDVMFLYSGNLNVPGSLRSLTEEKYVKEAKVLLDKNGLRHHDYFTPAKYNGEVDFNLGSIHARSTATSAALANCVSTLIEVRGIGIGRTSYKRRVYSTWLIAKSYIETAFNNPEELRSTLKTAQLSADSAVVKQKRKVYSDSIEVIELDNNSLIKIAAKFHDALHSISVFSRSRPQFYIIPESETAILERLKYLGIKVTRMNATTSLTVDQYEVQQYDQDPLKWEQVFVQNVESRLTKIEKDFPAGCFMLEMDQANANLAIELLEPEAENSLVRLNVIPTQQGAVLPYFRYPSQSN